MTMFTLAEMFYRPYLPQGGATAVIILLVSAALWSAWRSWGVSKAGTGVSLVMRVAAAVVIGWLLMGPSTRQSTVIDRQQTCVFFLLDRSASMQTRDVDGEARIDAARSIWFAQGTLNALREVADVRLLGFSERVEPLPDLQNLTTEQAAAGDQTQLSRSVMRTLADASSESNAMIVLISDGRGSDPRMLVEAGAAVRASGIPIHTVTLGGATLQQDLALTALPAQDYIFAGETGHIDVTILPVNATGLATTLKIQHGDEVETREVRFESDMPQRLRIPVEHDDPGVYEYQVTIDSLDQEQVTGNNQQSVFVEVTDDQLDVLIVEGEPYWDTKFLAQSLRMDERFAVEQVSQLTDARVQRVVSRADMPNRELPTTLEQWQAYDVVILGRNVENLLGGESLFNMIQYVRDGGRVIFSRGRAYNPQLSQTLGVIEPVIWAEANASASSGVQMFPTRRGRTHPAFAALPRLVEAVEDDLPALGLVTPIERVKAPATILAESGDEEPLLVTMPYGRGSVAMLLVSDLWQWSLFDRRERNLTGLYDTFWSNLLRCLVLADAFEPGAEVAMRVAQRTLARGATLDVDVVTKQMPLKDAELRLTLVKPDGSREPLALSPLAGQGMRARASTRLDTVGRYTLLLDAPGMTPSQIETPLNVYELDRERMQTAANPAAMRLLSQESGGRVLDPNEPGVLAQWIERQTAARQMPGRARYIWDSGWIMAALLTWLGLSWLFRRRTGMW